MQEILVLNHFGKYSSYKIRNLIIPIDLSKQHSKTIDLLYVLSQNLKKIQHLMIIIFLNY